MAILDTTKDLAAQFVQQAQATPNAVALEDENVSLTYADLDRETWALADKLRQYGVGREDLVGVLMGRSADNVIAFLAALRAGGAYLVLELAYPAGLLRDVIDDANPKVIVTQKAHAGNIKADVPVIIIDQPDATSIGAQKPVLLSAEMYAPLPCEEDIDRLAFVSYSSGTTGQPKGIANPHKASILSYDLRFNLQDLQPGDRVACNVFFVWEMLRPLLRGATTVAVPDHASYDPVGLVDFLSSRNITDTLMTPTLLATVLSRHSNLGEKLPHLKSLWLNGEVVTTDLCRRAFAALPQTRLLNVYSASETHEVAAGDIKTFVDFEARICPVGPPLDPEHIYILDVAGNRVAVGTSGELYVGGELLARGYLNLPETTAKAFQVDPFESRPDARMYRTGDMARLLPSGLLEITGRVGGMIKTRGYTVQPGAVETSIVKYLAVRDCAVVARGEGLEKQLVAYVVPDKGEPRGRTVLVVDESGYSPVARRALSDHLAHYMIPPLWVELDELPTHGVSGKVDLKALPPPPSPKTPAVKDKKKEHDTKIKMDTIVKMWAASLNVPVSAITPNHSFFDLGGHSLILADLAGRLTRAFGFPVPLAPLAGTPTLEGHLDAVRAARDGHTAAVQADLPAVLRADCILPDEIQSNGTPLRRLNDADTVLLTGTTGYLGAFLLKAILENTSAHVLCLVRFTEPAENYRPAGIARIRKNLIDLGIWDDTMLDRMEIVPGNLARNRLGLSPEAFSELASRVEVIIHAAATVNLVYPYAALRNANVGGTREILRLASRAGATVHHVSTNGVLPPSIKGWNEETMLDIDAVPEKLLDGYGQTKWVAEMLVYEAGRRGIPVKVYRPGTISGHSITGSTNTYDLLNALFVESLHLGYAPEVDSWLAEMTPVDFVSDAIITLANHPDTKQRLYHLGDPNPVTANEVFDSLNALGYPTKKLPFDDWVALWNEKRGSRVEDNPFTVDILRGGMPTVDTLQCVTVLKDDATQPALDIYGLKRPKIDTNLWETYARHFYARGWLPRPPRRLHVNGNGIHSSAKKGRLAGKVAVVTGASSGMGAAVATKLAGEGAHVAIAARRKDKLEELKNKLAGSCGKILAHPTDVTSAEQVQSLMKTVTEKLGDIDILVVCAGVMYFTLMANAQTEEWERTVDVNCKGLLHCLGSTVPGFLKRGKGHIVTISSDAGRKVFPGLGVYSGSKFFIEATLQALRLETANSGLRVTSIQPGNVDTDLLGISTDQEALKKYGEPSGAKVLDAEDVAGAIMYAVLQPEHVAVNEVLIEPREEPI
ncbi:putative NRPS-like protein biosynthetic cluster [Purpureocillium takamizusanense]|uniref:NRPS-like protein biosynthetic cluster n=1 Tax=Purpureocillium takamizusanense TaxID=2060973 RepID=A0A9Q8Q590_9HYPO|nr:putative NRPS-like protein biosynthetic cluster [Purpureocillium takamizusanense]UNI13913.1 putative NRPS-like protein biosynthetic cluster [Purpureocillium takamizusanense]